LLYNTNWKDLVVFTFKSLPATVVTNSSYAYFYILDTRWISQTQLVQLKVISYNKTYRERVIRVIKKLTFKRSNNMTNNPTGGVQTIDRALTILETLSNYDNLSLMEISEKVQLHKATTHRLINSLLQNGYIEKDPTTKNTVSL